MSRRFYRIEHDGAPRQAVEENGAWRLVDGDIFGEWRAGDSIAGSGHRLLAPVMPSKIVAIGLNYKDHAAEQGKAIPAEPLMFLKPSTAVIGPGDPIAAGDAQLPKIRQAIRTERKIGLSYRDNNGADSKRIIWPFALSFFEKVRVVVAWCELREDFRHFRTDRIVVLNMTEKRYPRRRQAMLKEWRERELTKDASDK